MPTTDTSHESCRNFDHLCCELASTRTVSKDGKCGISIMTSHELGSKMQKEKVTIAQIALSKGREKNQPRESRAKRHEIKMNITNPRLLKRRPQAEPRRHQRRHLVKRTNLLIQKRAWHHWRPPMLHYAEQKS